MRDKTTYGIIGVLSLIIATLGGNMYLTEEQIDNAYICTYNEKIGFFEEFSSTMKTGYYYEDGIKKSQVCRNGVWTKLKEYAEQNNLTINKLLNQEKQTSYQKKYDCGRYACIEKELVV